MALRFVPRFLNQLGVIRNGQKAMGRDVSEGRLLDRIKYGLQMLSILVTWSLENAIETSDSMRSRGYGLRGRTAFSVYRFTKRDCCLGTLMAGLFAVLQQAVPVELPMRYMIRGSYWPALQCRAVQHR